MMCTSIYIVEVGFLDELAIAAACWWQRLDLEYTDFSHGDAAFWLLMLAFRSSRGALRLVLFRSRPTFEPAARQRRLLARRMLRLVAPPSGRINNKTTTTTTTGTTDKPKTSLCDASIAFAVFTLQQ